MPLIRPSTEADVPAIAAIYAHHVLHGTGTFEIDPPSAAEHQPTTQLDAVPQRRHPGNRL